MITVRKFGLKSETIQSINAVFSKHTKITMVMVYGSRAKGNFKPGSDIDLTIKDKELTTDDLLLLENELEDLMLPYKIDLSLYHKIENPSLIEHIDRVGQVFFSTV